MAAETGLTDVPRQRIFVLKIYDPPRRSGKKLGAFEGIEDVNSSRFYQLRWVSREKLIACEGITGTLC